jgi:hypothetical protein
MMSMLCNCCVRELLILARTWFAFGLPSKTGCDTPPPMQRGQQPEGSQHIQHQRDFREESEARTVNSTVLESKHIY